MSKNYTNASQTSEIIKYISDTMKVPIMGAGGGFAPIGMYGWSPDYVTGAPQGWLRCEGQEVNIADYPELATFYASQHGASNYWGGDGITTFAVPDLRGEFIRGAGTNSHANQGNGGAVGEHQDATYIPDYGSNASATLIAQRMGSANENNVGNQDKSLGASTRALTVTGTISTESWTQNKATGFSSRPTNTSGVFFVKATVADDPNGHHYSTEEQVVGMTEDGEDIYERVIKGTTPSTKANPVIIESVSNMNLLSVDGTIDKRYPIGAGYPYYPSDSQFNSVIYINGARTSLLICVGENLVNLPYRAVIQYTKSS